MNRLTLTGYSTALYSTWLFLQEFGVLFDCGDGVAAGLLGKSRKARHVFITHADRDHLAGLLQFYQLNARNGQPTIYYPAACGSFPALRDFLLKFDPHQGPATWIPLEAGQEVKVAKNHVVVARRNQHVQSTRTKSLDYLLVGRRRKLRPEFSSMAGPEIARYRMEHGEDATTLEIETSLFGYSGDSPSLDPSRWLNVETLVHEATFLEAGATRGAHASLGEVIVGASELRPERLVLGHFSPRYDRRTITEAILEACEAEAVSFPVWAIFPGEVVRDLFSSSPIFDG